jgi:hypothetical protein
VITFGDRSCNGSLKSTGEKVMTVGDDVQPVAVFAISPNANEDRWAQATWHAELAAREAATAAGATKDDMTGSFEGHGVVVITTASGQRFEAWVVTDPKVSPFSFGERVDPSGYGRPARPQQA